MSSRPLLIARFGLWTAGFAIFSAFAHAAEDGVSSDYVIREWHASDGLPSEQISRINQDAAGFLWVATTDGVVRFDGSHFEKYPLGTDANAKTRLMAWTPRIGVVAAVISGGLVVLDHGAFRPWRPAEYQNRRVVTMFVEPAGVLWLACEDGAVIRDDGQNFKTFGAEDGLPRVGPRTFATDGNGRVWISIDSFVARYDGVWVPQGDGFNGSELRLASSTKNGPWAISRDRVWRFEESRFVEVATLPSRLGAHYIQVALEDRNGALWIGTRSQGLHLLADGILQRVPTPSEDIYALFEDREGSLWAGTNGAGLDRIHRKSYRLYDKSTGLLDNYSYTACTDTHGDVWLANRDGGVVRLRGGVVNRFDDLPGWPTFATVSVFPKPGGGIGVTTGMGAFWVTGNDTPSIRRIEAIPASPAARVTYTARNGDCWLTLDVDRIGRLRGEVLESFDRERGMEGREIRAITEDREGHIWIGGADGNLFRMNGDRFERVPLPGIETGAIQTIRIEPDGRVWLATLAAGVVVWSGGKTATCDVRHGLPDNDITQILPDDHGFIWFGSKHSIFRVSRQEMDDVLAGRISRVVPRLIGPDDGIKDIACSGLFQPGAWKSPDGTLWFATRRGMLALDPSRQLVAQPPPPVTIEEVACDDRPVPFAAPLKIDAQTRKLEFRFGVLCLASPESVQAAYRLDGFDDDWITANASHRAAYPRLRPGAYRFRVKASLGEGTAVATNAVLDFVVVPRWWQTDWFRVAALLAGALGVIVSVRAWSHRRLQRQVEKLERESAIRTRIAQNIHDDLGANLTQISLLTQAARQSPATSVKNFEQIHATVGEITRSMDEIVWAVNPKFDDVESLAGYLGDFAGNFLRVAGIRCRLELPAKLPELTLASQTRHHLFLCCKEALHNIVKHSGATEATIAMTVEGSRLTISISDNGRGVAAADAGARTTDRVASGNGLENMRQRLSEIGGNFSIQPGGNGGTCVIFSVEGPPPSP